eukprot:Seg4610.2 transcript_id=Seg4610.2/GoldUCD/mRNA.D3Y31 product="hypothetical protein" protein_id=Seg4610.2/GoldUCD/D3Y31
MTSEQGCSSSSNEHQVSTSQREEETKPHSSVTARMQLGRFSQFEQSLRKEITNLDHRRCEALLENSKDLSKEGSPIFVFICQEKALWKTVCSTLGVDLRKKLSTEDFRETISERFSNLNQRDKAYFTNRPDILSKLEKIVVEGIFENFVSLFVSYGYDVNETDFSGLTALHHAIKHAFLHMADTLVKNGADAAKEARIASWIRSKMPAVYHSLYYRDFEMTRLILHSSKGIPQIQINSMDDFVYLPRNVTPSVLACLNCIQEINPFIFMMIIIIIQSHRNPTCTTEMLDQFIDIATTCRNVFTEMDSCEFPVPDCILEFRQNCLLSLTKKGVFQGKFFFQVTSALFDMK